MSAKDKNIVKDSTSLFRDMIDTAIQSNLKKNELIIFMFLMKKLLGYGKGRDAITLSQFDYGINPEKKDRKKYPNPTIHLRKDHIKIALEAFIKKGIFSRKPHEKYQHEYRIGEEILGDFDGIFFTPTLPKNGKNAPKQENLPENRGHTALDLNSPLFLQIQPRSSVINISTEMPYFPLTFLKEEPCSGNLKDKTAPPPEREWSPQWDWETAGLAVPDSISPSNHRFCKNNLLKATVQQATDALTVYHNMWNKGTVNNPPFLLKSLIEKAQTGDLALPQRNERATLRIAKVPSTLDDSLTRYARENGFSEPRRDAGFGYLEYRNALVREREIKLKALNQQAENQPLSAKTHTSHIPKIKDDTQQAATPPVVPPIASDTPKNDCNHLNNRSNQATRENTSLQDIAFKTKPRKVLNTRNTPIEVPEAAKKLNPMPDDMLSHLQYLLQNE